MPRPRPPGRDGRAGGRGGRAPRRRRRPCPGPACGTAGRPIGQPDGPPHPHRRAGRDVRVAGLGRERRRPHQLRHAEPQHRLHRRPQRGSLRHPRELGYAAEGRPNCEFDWGDAFAVGPKGRGHGVCHGDTALPAPGQKIRILKYGTSITLGKITCPSRTTGLTCRNTAGHGFSLSREKIRVFQRGGGGGDGRGRRRGEVRGLGRGTSFRTVLLYDSPELGNCYKVRLMLARTGIAYERVALARGRPLRPRPDHRPRRRPRPAGAHPAP